MNKKNYKLIEDIRERRLKRLDGGPGSGNWGHASVKGKHGGSAPGGGNCNKYVDANGKFTSFAKLRNQSAKLHQPTATELKDAPIGSKLIHGKDVYTKASSTKWTDSNQVEIGSYSLNKNKLWGEQVKIHIPKSAEEEFMNGKATKYNGEKTSKVSSAQDTPIGTPVSEGNIESEKTTGGLNAFGYDKAQVDNAKQYTPKETIAAYKEQTENCWASLDQQSKKDLYSYTTGSCFVNEPLHQIQYKGYKDDDSVKAIENITNAINKCEIPADTILTHGVDTSGFEKFTGLYLNDPEEAKTKLIGNTYNDNGFVSCGAAKNTGFTSKQVQMKIFAPKGSKGMYVEPFSNYGHGTKGANWNGKVTQTTTGSECEIILQRGGGYKITNVTYNKSKYQWEVDCELVYQDTSFNQYSSYVKN